MPRSKDFYMIVCFVISIELHIGTYAMKYLSFDAQQEQKIRHSTDNNLVIARDV